jgi:radical SAM superfamily enzyme YgiQ (UPF0313 family)
VKGLAYRDATGENIFNEIALVETLDDVEVPDYDAINLDGYIEKGYRYQGTKKRNAPIWTTRGCPYRCSFCTVPVINGRKLRKHSIGYLIKWIQLLYTKHNIRGFIIIDDNFTFDIDYAKTFCKEVIKLRYDDIGFYSPNGVRMQRGDLELWTLMKKAGWSTLVVAPESGSERVLKSMRKDLDVKKVPEYIKGIKKAGLKVHGFIIVGFPGETREDIKETELLVRRCRFDAISSTTFQPFPGTPIYDELVERGDIDENALPEYFRGVLNYRYVSPTLTGFDFESFHKKLAMTMYLHNPLSLFRIFMDKVIQNPSILFTMPLRTVKKIPALAKIYFKKQLQSKSAKINNSRGNFS